MTKLIALITIIALMFIVQLGNFWVTYGIWPRSWGAFVVFALIGMLLSSMLQRVMKDDD